MNTLKAPFCQSESLAVSASTGDNIGPSPREAIALLREIRAEQARQRETLADILRLLERGRGARDQADVSLLMAIAEAIGDRPFTSAQLVAHASADPALREALLAADITTPRELGTLCRRLEGVPLAGLCLTRVDTHRDGIVWRVQVFDPQTRAA